MYFNPSGYVFNNLRAKFIAIIQVFFVLIRCWRNIVIAQHAKRSNLPTFPIQLGQQIDWIMLLASNIFKTTAPVFYHKKATKRINAVQFGPLLRPCTDYFDLTVLILIIHERLWEHQLNIYILVNSFYLKYFRVKRFNYPPTLYLRPTFRPDCDFLEPLEIHLQGKLINFRKLPDIIRPSAIFCLKFH